jgi:hypothetical protein
MVPLTDNARIADIGGRSGCYYFNSERAHLCLTADATAPVNQVYAITLSAGLAASYYFQFRGMISTTTAHNAAVGVMQTTLAAMTSFCNAKGRAPTFVCSATAAAGTSFAISVTCDDPEQVLGNDLITVVTMEAKTSASSLTTIGEPGFTSGTYDLVTIGMKQSVLHMLDGNLVTEDA